MNLETYAKHLGSKWFSKPKICLKCRGRVIFQCKKGLFYVFSTSETNVAQKKWKGVIKNN